MSPLRALVFVTYCLQCTIAIQYLTTGDVQLLKTQFTETINKGDAEDVQSAYHSVAALQLLNEKVDGDAAKVSTLV
jgi:hypothetical protein